MIKPEITQLFLTNNNCYKTGKKHEVNGMMYHSTGANNPLLSRYVGPNDGILGVNPYNNHWNTPKPGGRNVCVHAFIGRDKNGKVRIYQTLPWDHVGWHSGVGLKGSANTLGIIGVEICEDAKSDKRYFMECIEKLNELTAYLSVKYGFPINENTVFSHREGHQMGIASNHGDIEHWSRLFGYDMNNARADIKRILEGEVVAVDGFRVGDKVTVKKSARKYATGQNIPNFVKGSTYTIYKVETRRLLLREITSWVNIEDVEGYKSTHKPSKPITPKAKLVLDGYWGPTTTKALQKNLGTLQDGIISGQYRNKVTNAIPSVRFGTKGSLVVKALQSKIKVKADGYIGPDTIRGLQRYLKTPVDGVVSRPSIMVREMQRRLNAGTF